MDADPRERVDDPLGPLRPVAGLVGVFDAQHERAAESLREGPVVQRRARPADVEEAGRRWGESESRGTAHVRSTLPAAPFRVGALSTRKASVPTQLRR